MASNTERNPKGGQPEVLNEAALDGVQGAGGGPHVRVIDGTKASGGDASLVNGAGMGGGPHVKVFSGVAAGGVNGDGTLDIITAAGPGGGPHVR